MLNNEKKSFKQLLTGLFAFESKPSQVTSAALQEVVDQINPSYKVIGLVGIGKEGAVIKVEDVAKSSFALKIASPFFNEPGKSRHKVFGLIKVEKEDENSFKTRFINGCAVQKELCGHIRTEGVTYLRIPESVEVIEKPGLIVKMEYIESVNLLQHLRSNRDFKKSMLLYLQLLQCISFIQYYGFVHRDLKPENIGITGDYKQKVQIAIFDWTMAKRCLIDSGTIPGTVGGTVPYNSDKLILDGEFKDANFSDDVFSIGIMLYEFCKFEKVPKPVNASRLYNDKAARKEYIDFLKKFIPPFLVPLYCKATNPIEAERYEYMEQYLVDFTQALNNEGFLTQEEWDIFSKQYREITLENLAEAQERLEKVVINLQYNVSDILSRLNKISKACFPNTDHTITARTVILEKPKNEE